MIDALLSALGFDWRGLAAILAAAGAAIGWAFIKGRSSGKASDARGDLDALRRGQEAVARGQSSGETPDERLRRNDGKWQ